MKLALVFNPFSYKLHEENLRPIQRYFGLFPPLSLAWVASIARRAGHDVIIVDARTLRLSMAETAEVLKRFRPDVIGAMMTTYMFPETLEWLSFLRGELHAAGMRPKVLVGGYNLRVYPRESLAHPDVDFGCEGHAYYTVPELLKALEEGRSDLSGVPGLVWKRDASVVVNPHPQRIVFDDFPLPARDLLPNDLYAEFPTRRRNFTVMVTSLGCPHRCVFCEAGGCEYNPRSPATVLAEMKECAQRHGVREIDIFDYQFTADRARVRDICRGMLESKLDIEWACRSRVDAVDPDLLRLMASAGCRRIYWGIEHSSQIVLDGLGKGMRLEAAAETLRSARSAGIENLGFFLVGTPGETRESVARTVAFAQDLDLDYVQFSKLLAKPMTPLWRQMTASTGRDYWRDWVLGKETDRDLPRPWLTTLCAEELDALVRQAYLTFHSRPGFLLQHVLRCRSLTELFRKVAAYASLRFSPDRPGTEGFQAYPENIVKVALRKWAWLRRHG
ncbi:MAG: radical SAM protein [Elusimicrobia bacterium]|nr:radical SAM protein [Elusimicrobiota bacterium]